MSAVNIATFEQRSSVDPVGREVWARVREAYSLPENPTVMDLRKALGGIHPPISESERVRASLSLGWLFGELEELPYPYSFSTDAEGNVFKVELGWDDWQIYG